MRKGRGGVRNIGEPRVGALPDAGVRAVELATNPDAAVLFFDVGGTLVWMTKDDLGDDVEFTDFGPSEPAAAAFKQLN